ncbi:MAG: hypothetical protein ACOCNC_12180, partial [Acetivibrio ethanolgignens]
MKKNKSIPVIGMLFFAMLLVDLYLIKNTGSVPVLAMAGIVTLAAAYLFFDKLYDLFLRHQEEKEAQEAIIQSFCEETQKADKAKYIMLKKTQELLEEKLSKTADAQQELKAALEQLLQDQNKNAKLVVKYNREDSKKLAALSKADAEKLIATVNQAGEKQLAALRKMKEQLLVQKNIDSADKIIEALDRDFTELGNKLGSLSVTVAGAPVAETVTQGTKTEEIEPVVEEPAMEAELEIEESVIESAPEVEEPAPAPEPEPEPAAPEIDLSDPNKQLSQDDIAALLASMGAGEDTVAEEPEAEAVPEVEEPAPEPEPEPEPAAPEIDLS